jgi:hypothetical protein
MILNPNFGRNNRNAEAWTMDAGNKNLCGGTNENKCAESWRSAFTLSQEIEVPNGVYALTAQAALTDYAELWDGAEYPVVYANAESMPFNNMEGSDRSSNMNTLSAAFANGNYKVGPIYLTVTDGKLTIGVKGTRTDTWAIWDNFQLKYYGTDANIDNLKGGAENKELDELRKKAADLSKEVEIAAVKAVLDNAISETANVSGDDAIKAAIATLKAAVAQVLSNDEGSCVGISNEVGTAKIANPFANGDVSYVESPYSYNSIPDFRDNIRSIRNIWLGSTDKTANTYSFHSFFASVNKADINSSIENGYVNAITAISNMPSAFVKYCCTIWKIDFEDDEEW